MKPKISPKRALCPKYATSRSQYGYDHNYVANDRNVTPMTKAKRKLDISNTKCIKSSKEFTLVHYFFDEVRYFQDMAISRFDLGKSWPISHARWMRWYAKHAPTKAYCKTFKSLHIWQFNAFYLYFHFYTNTRSIIRLHNIVCGHLDRILSPLWP